MQIGQFTNLNVLLQLKLHYMIQKIAEITIATNFFLATDTLKFQMKWPFSSFSIIPTLLKSEVNESS